MNTGIIAFMKIRLDNSGYFKVLEGVEKQRQN